MSPSYSPSESPFHTTILVSVLFHYAVCCPIPRSPVPVVVTEMVRDNEDGLPEKQLPKNNIYHL